MCVVGPLGKFKFADPKKINELNLEPADLRDRLEHFGLQCGRQVPRPFPAHGDVESEDQTRPAARRQSLTVSLQIRFGGGAPRKGEVADHEKNFSSYFFGVCRALAPACPLCVEL